MTTYRKPAPYRKPQEYRGGRLPTVRFAQVSAALPWAMRPRLRKVTSLSFSHAARVSRELETPWGKAARVSQHAALPFVRIGRVTQQAALPFGHATPVSAKTVSIGWQRPSRLAERAVFPWTMPPRLRMDASMPFASPPRLRVDATIAWTMPPRLRIDAALPFTAPPRVARRWYLPWGHAPRVQWVVRPPTTEPPVVPPKPLYQPPPGFAVALNFSCLQPDVVGFAVPIRFGACFCAQPRSGVVIVLNSANVITALTRQPIEVSSIGIGESIDSMHHTFSLALADPDDLAWLTPSAGVPIEVEININGYLRTGIVESWEEDYQFPGKSVSVSGRATTALLDAPYVDARSYIEPAERLAAQLVDRELTDTGFDCDYGAIDWLVTAGAWSYTGATPAGAINTIAQASGSVARSHPYNRTFEILPRFPISPWSWATSEPDVQIPADYVPRLVARDATSGMATYELDLPLFPLSDADKPGLLRPGMLVELLAEDSWRAQVSGVRIAANSQQAGGANALVVWQTVTLEAAPAEPRYTQVLVSGQTVGVSDPIIRDGTDGVSRLPQIVDPLITQHTVAAERGRNALAGDADNRAAGNYWRALLGVLPQSRTIKGNVTAVNVDGSYTIATADGSTIRARAQGDKTWTVLDGVLVQDGYIIDAAPSLPGVTQYV